MSNSIAHAKCEFAFRWTAFRLAWRKSISSRRACRIPPIFGVVLVTARRKKHAHKCLRGNDPNRDGCASSRRAVAALWPWRCASNRHFLRSTESSTTAWSGLSPPPPPHSGFTLKIFAFANLLHSPFFCVVRGAFASK